MVKQIKASAKYQVQGETLSGGQLRAAQVSPDRDRRKAALEAEQQTVLAQADTLEQLLRDLIHARNDLARANGFDNFADYGDLAMQRIGYGRAELDAPYRMPFIFANCSGTASDVTVYISTNQARPPGLSLHVSSALSIVCALHLPRRIWYLCLFAAPGRINRNEQRHRTKARCLCVLRRGAPR